MTASALTDDDIYDAAARRIAPWPLCFDAFGTGETRRRAREEIARMIREAGSK